MNLVAAIQKLWYASGNFRVEKIADQQQRRRAILFNQWIFLGSSYSVGVIFLSAGIYLYLFLIGVHDQYKGHIIPYLVTEAVPIATGLFLYLAHAFRPGIGNFAINTYFLSFVAYNFLMALLLGPESGFQFALLAIILVPYVAYPGQYKKYLPLGLITLAAIIVAHYLQFRHAPYYPVPQVINHIIFRILITTVILFDAISILYIGLHYDVFRKIYDRWKLLTGYGEQLFTDADDIKANRIVNGGFIIATGLLLILLLILTGIGTIIALAGYRGFGLHALVYCLITFIFLFYVVFLFYVKIRTGRYMSLQLLGDYSVAFFVALMSLGLGREIRFYLFLAPMILTPFFFIRTTARIIAVSQILFIALLALSYLYSATYEPLLPLPAPIVSGLIPVVDFFLGVLSLIFFVYTWWKFEFTAKIQRVWRILSRFGIRAHLTPQQAKTEIISNLCMYIDAALMISAALITSAFYFLGVSQAACIVPPAVATTLVLTIFFVLRTWNFARNTLTLAIYVVTLLDVFLLAIFLGEDFVIHYLFFTTLVVPFFIFDRGRRRWITTAILLNIASIMAVVWFFDNHRPLYPPYDSAFIADVKKYLRLTINGLIVSAMTVVAYFVWHESNLAAEKLDDEREKADDLLLNILPREIADELKSTGRSLPRSFASASVLFTDFVGFTQIAEKLTPAELVKELDHCFSFFDSVISRHNLEKIKTIGDSYMAAGGIPEANHTHLLDCILAALEIRTFMEQLKESREAQGLEYWQLRIGINTGPLVAGIVGNSKFIYDCWGDSVNTASRMESSGAPGRINLSAQAHEQAKYFFECEDRGFVQAKRKGELAMFFVNRLKPQFSADASGTIPNDAFQRFYRKIQEGARVKYRHESRILAEGF